MFTKDRDQPASANAGAEVQFMQVSSGEVASGISRRQWIYTEIGNTVLKLRFASPLLEFGLIQHVKKLLSQEQIGSLDLILSLDLLKDGQ